MLAFYMSLVDDENEKKIIEELYNSNKQTMYSIALSCLHNPQDAEDVVHEAFLVAIKKSKKIFSIPFNKRIPFLDVIVRNKCYSVLRRKKLTDSENEEKMTRKEVSPEEIVISDIECKHLIQLLNDLPEGQKDVMYLIRLGFTTEEIALSLSISENAVRNRIFHARKNIREKLDNH